MVTPSSLQVDQRRVEAHWEHFAHDADIGIAEVLKKAAGVRVFIATSEESVEAIERFWIVDPVEDRRRSDVVFEIRNNRFVFFNCVRARENES